MSEPRGTRQHAHVEAREHLSEGRTVVMAPEGLRSWAGQIHRLEVEVARLALATGVLVVPAHVSDGNLVLGRPVDLSRHTDTPHSYAVLRAATDDIALALCDLTGLTYQDYPAVRGDLRPRPLIWLSRVRRQRRDRKKRRQFEQERLWQESTLDAEELAREEEKARLAAQLQARKASLADRLAEHGIHPGK
ncbi:1-acyl-sn-glycerol-3-phosphate acyltransferase [Cutibacterium sp.]|uniref:1-acyl-sn-glycerol-3-phosphate acyltransferase n=1 Tax=Cutibacterium sp. TaxID=1912221 RepID=UPI0026DD647B|nr:1-acyl-sn-glycerol-3-phosphate acyltransferase [Cutibacterium sp.]MDO4411613.1 1-acyl-sn-glycerol-3-phosphate acyltransferase [Cutibacterium sp.]